MTENERVKLVRKSEQIDITLEKFGDMVGVTKGAMSAIESGKRAVTDQMRRSICREFHVNEHWLRTGEGEMFQDRSMGEEIAAFLSDLPDTSFKKRFIAMLAGLDESDWAVLEKMALAMQEERPKQETIDGMTRELSLFSGVSM